MTPHGKNYIGFERAAKSKTAFQAINPATGEKLDGFFKEATLNEVAQAAEKAAEAFQEYRKKSGIEKAIFLEAIAEEIIALGDALITRCCQESGLPVARITGERGRTTGQLQLFAQFLREGSWVQASIDSALPERQPLPRPDIRSMQIALGPVAVFGASNFPLAFSVAGGDTVSALAAGCSVVLKAHPAHPGTCELIASAIIKATQKTNMPDGVFSMVHGGAKVGLALVNNKNMKAVGFTGSFKVGKALFDAAAKRKEPIPVYAEMGSINPVFVLPEALKQNGEGIAQGFANSVNLGVGQFCTNPGMLIVEALYATSLLNNIKSAFRSSVGGTMLTEGIQKNYDRGIAHVKSIQNVEILGEGTKTESQTSAVPIIFKVGVNDILKESALTEEVFGPSSVVVLTDKKSDLVAIAKNLDGHLTATLFGTPQDLIDNKDLIDVLEQKVGRLIINAFPTGVEVCHSMVHGGSYPATTFPASTSVGTNAIYRFTKPVCFQGFSDDLLPDALKQANPLNIVRKINGKYEF